MEIIPRLFKIPKESFFLFGPRGTGKSTWLKANFNDALWLDLLEPDVFRLYSARPERLRDLVLAHKEKKVVIIDEIQKVPRLLDVVHFLVETKPKIRFVLTGSSARKLKRGGVDLLAGRLARYHLCPFMAAELGKRFNLRVALEQGMLPLVLGAPSPEKALKSYVALYMQEEVQAEGLVRNLGGFARFLEAISFSQGQVLNISNVAADCQIDRKVVEGYIGILEDILLSLRIPVFSKRAKRKTVSHPKFYYFDAGVYRSLRPCGPLDSPEDIAGGALEGMVLQHLMAWNAYRGEKNKIFYWRTRCGVEVDFIVYGREVFWAIEVKNTARLRDEDLRPLLSFKQDYPQCRLFFLYRGRERLLRKGVLCLPCEEFLLRLHPQRLIGFNPG